MRRAMLCAALGAVGAVAAADVVSTFDTDDEGWGLLNDATAFAWDGTLGDPAGAIRARDIGSGNVWYFAASSAYHGDMSAAYGQALSWDLLGIANDHTTIPGSADVMLTGAGMTIGLNAGVQPVNGSWTSWSVTIGAGDWRAVTNTAGGVLGGVVSEADVRAVLADLTGLYLRGEYSNVAGDEMALDNVRLVPSPGALGVLGAGVLVMGRRRR